MSKGRLPLIHSHTHTHSILVTNSYAHHIHSQLTLITYLCTYAHTLIIQLQSEYPQTDSSMCQRMVLTIDGSKPCMASYDQANMSLYSRTFCVSSFLNSMGRFFATINRRCSPSSLTLTSSSLAVLTHCNSTNSFARNSRALPSSCSVRFYDTSMW